MALRVWILPMPFFSHVLSISQFAAQLARLGVSPTVFVTRSDLERLNLHNQLVPKWKVEGIDVQFRILDCAGAVLADGVGNQDRFLTPFREVEETFLEVLKSSVTEGSQPSCVVVDFCGPRVMEGGAKLGVPMWMYLIHPISALAAASYLYRLSSKGILTLPASPREKIAQELFISLPGYPAMRICDLAEQMFEAHPEYDIMMHHTQRALTLADVVLGSTFHDLEPDGYKALQQILNHEASLNSKKGPVVMAVGPTITLPTKTKNFHKNEFGNDVFDSCMEFLDRQPSSSVIYVSFGCDVNVGQEQIQELVCGLDKTQHPFLCVLHPPKRSADSVAQVDYPLSVLPEELRARIATKSLFVKWAPQIEILAHPATGAFLTHCGISSVMDSLSTGVPMIGWPWLNDQPMNYRALVDGSKLVLEVRPWLVRDELVRSEDIERSVNTLFRSEEGAELTRRVRSVKHALEEAVGPDGSTTRNLRALVDRLSSTVKRQPQVVQ